MDIEYHVTDDDLAKIGIDKGSMTLIDAPKKQALLNQLGPCTTQCCGGSVANSLFVATQLGHSGHHLGVIGSDDIAKATIQSYNRDGIGHSFNTLQTDGESGCCIVLITPDGERSMLTYLGVSPMIHVADPLIPIIEASTALFIEGYLLTDDACYAALMHTIIPHAHRHKTAVYFSLSDAGLIHAFNDRFQTILRLTCAKVFCNKAEAVAMTNESTPNRIWGQLQSLTAELIMTDGPNGAMIFNHHETITCPTDSVSALDSTGAGDAFAGTYIAMRSLGKSHRMSGQMANKIANLVVQTVGARPNGIKELYHETISI